MQIYITKHLEGGVVAVNATLKAAHDDAKLRPGRQYLSIHLCDAPTDKESLVEIFAAALLGEKYELRLSTLLRMWTLTDRGGLKELGTGE